MNRLTIFGDIHDNLPALEAVLADIEGCRLRKPSRLPKYRMNMHRC